MSDATIRLGCGFGCHNDKAVARITPLDTKYEKANNDGWQMGGGHFGQSYERINYQWYGSEHDMLYLHKMDAAKDDNWLSNCRNY